MNRKEACEEEVSAQWIARLLAVPYRIGGITSAVVFFVLYVVFAELSYAFVITPGSNAVFWLPSGITFSAFVRARWCRKIWPFWLVALFLGQLFVVLKHGVPPFTAFCWALANVVLPLTAAFLSRSLVISPFDLRHQRDVLTLAALVTLSVIPGGIIAAIGSYAGRSPDPFIVSAISWAASDAIGIILLAPVILSWATRAPKPSGSFAEAILLFPVLTVCTFATLSHATRSALDRSLLSFLFFFVAWAAVRFGATGTAFSLLIIDVIQVWATRFGFGPFASPWLTVEERILNLQILVANIGLLMLLLAAAIEQHRTARIAAEDALKSRDEFLSIASHELKTPLTSLALQVQMINRFTSQGALTAPSTEKLADLARVSERQLRRYFSLIDDLLDVSRIRADRLTLNLEEVDLSEAVQEVANRFRTESESKRSFIELHGDRRLVGHWDRTRLEQIITNLLSNALKYGAGRPIEITTQQEGDSAKLVVRDNGIGISREDQARIFDRFERAASIKRFGGMGLGLFIVRQLVEAHGGSIRVESEVGQGASFRVELPLHLRRAA